MKKELRFYKEADKWYLDFPGFLEAGGDKSSLEMILGADSFLNMVANNESEVNIMVDAKNSNLPKKKDNSKFYFTMSSNTVEDGKFYTSSDNHVMWLCPIMLLIFDSYPKLLIINKA